MQHGLLHRKATLILYPFKNEVKSYFLHMQALLVAEKYVLFHSSLNIGYSVAQ